MTDKRCNVLSQEMTREQVSCCELKDPDTAPSRSVWLIILFQVSVACVALSSLSSTTHNNRSDMVFVLRSCMRRQVICPVDRVAHCKEYSNRPPAFRLRLCCT